MAKLSLIGAFFAILVASAFAKDAPKVPGFRVPHPPTIDGIIDEAGEWSGVPAFEGLVDMSLGKPAAESGKFWIAYDADFIYFAARLADSQPSQIRAHEFRTNVDFSTDDSVQLGLDITGSLAGFNTFTLNPNGATRTALAGGRAAKREWAGEFVAKGRITDKGWEVEARIPWQIMQLSKSGKRDIRLYVSRTIARLGQSFTNSFVGNGQTDNVTKWLDISVPKLALDRRLKMLAYGYAGYDPNQAGTFAAGADFKSALADQVQLVGTIHPDFRNIEKGILSLDFSRFERLANETRPFFQEGGQYFNSALFASQRIKTFDFGVSSYGRVNDSTSFSVLDAIELGKQNSFVANVTNDPDPNTSWRATVTNQETSGLSNSAYLIRLSKQQGIASVFLREMGSKDTTNGFGRNDTAQLYVQKDGWQSFVGYSEVNPQFTPRLGFAPEVDYKGIDYQLGYMRQLPKGRLLDYNVNFSGTSYDHYNGAPYRREQTSTASATLRDGLGLDLAADFASFEGSQDELYSAQATFPRYNALNQLSLGVSAGHQAGTAYRSILIGGARRLWNRLQITLSHQKVNYATLREQTVVGLNYDLGHDRSLSGRLFRQPSGLTNVYAAFSQKGNLGTEYFLIVGDPNAPTFHASVILKVVIPFTIGADPVKKVKKDVG